MSAIKGIDGVDSGTLYRLADHVKSYVNSQQINHNANQELEVLNALYEAEQVTGNGDPQRKLAYGRRLEKLQKLIGD